MTTMTAPTLGDYVTVASALESAEPFSGTVVGIFAHDGTDYLAVDLADDEYVAKVCHDSPESVWGHFAQTETGQTTSIVVVSRALARVGGICAGCSTDRADVRHRVNLIGYKVPRWAVRRPICQPCAVEALTTSAD